ncbi:hypothetical protein Ocin01_03045 [Orchesella cincta]|uniref:Uncharacterized protein n=1 Tax=Orchesella cincta TaxID=48709 RepID=A0A1D2NED1_ORCCI|nr:hypothetical protein Ocin01_03045 [Orchesella cincta]
MSYRYLNSKAHALTDDSRIYSASAEVLCITPEPTPRKKLRFKESPQLQTVRRFHKSSESLVDKNGQPKRSILRKSTSAAEFPGCALTSSKPKSSIYLSRERISKEPDNNLTEMVPRMENVDRTKTAVTVGVNTDVTLPPRLGQTFRRHVHVPSNWQRPQRTYKSFQEIIAAQPIENQAKLIDTINDSCKILFRPKSKFGSNLNRRR